MHINDSLMIKRTHFVEQKLATDKSKLMSGSKPQKLHSINSEESLDSQITPVQYFTFK